MLLERLAYHGHQTILFVIKSENDGLIQIQGRLRKRCTIIFKVSFYAVYKKGKDKCKKLCKVSVKLWRNRVVGTYVDL